MKKGIKVRLWVLIFPLILGGLICLIVVIGIVHPTNRVIETWKQPDSINYGDGSPYCLAVMERGIDISSFPIYSERQYCIFVGLDIGKPTYGHVVDFTFYPDEQYFDNIDEYIKMSAVTWTDEGVTFQEKNGDRIFIPKSSFINTR